MEYLTRDPIIEAYFNFRNANEEDVPVFSETVLRLAVKHVLQFKNQREDEVLSMYRMLMTTMLHFNNGKTLDELEEIMICYDRDELIRILNDTDNVEDSWKIFTVEEMMYFIRKNAYFIIMSEWVRRFARLYGKAAITDEKLGDMTLRIHDYFSWPVKSVHQWKRSFESKFLKGNSKEFDDHDVFVVKETDLTVGKISTDLNDKLHPLIDQDNLQNFVSSIKSIDGDTLKELQAFKRRRKEYKCALTIQNDKKVEKFAEQTIEMFIKADESADKKPEIITMAKDDDYDDDVEYVHVVQLTDDDDFEVEIDASSRKHTTNTSDDDDDDESNVDDEDILTKEVIIVQEHGNDPSNTHESQHSNNNELIDDEQATKYLTALQAYAVVNGLFEAIGLLDQVDSIFRTRFEKNL